MTYETERMIWLVVFFDFATFLTKSAKLFGKMPRAEARLVLYTHLMLLMLYIPTWCS